MKKRYPLLIGGIALVVASQFMDFGLGFRDGGSAVTVPEAKEAEESSPAMVSLSPGDSAATTKSTDAPVMGPALVDVLIDDDRYLVVTDASKPSDRQPMTVEEIVTMVGNVPGEPSGIKIRITRTPEALAVADAALIERLNLAAIPADQIDARRTLVSP